jgi:hypothetical protein
MTNQRNPKPNFEQRQEERRNILKYLNIIKGCFYRRGNKKRSLINGMIILNRKSQFILFTWHGRWSYAAIRADCFTCIPANRFQNLLKIRTERKYGQPILIDNFYLKEYISRKAECNNDQSKFLAERYGLQKDTPSPAHEAIKVNQEKNQA